MACGTGRTCDDNAVCVRCRDTAAGKGQDEGCTAGAPVCMGTGTAATCAGCTKDIDCDDGNECTTESALPSCVVSPVTAGAGLLPAAMALGERRKVRRMHRQRVARKISWTLLSA